MLWTKVKLKTEQIYNDFGKLIFSIAYEILEDYQLSEDALQEAALRIVRCEDRIKLLEGDELRNYVARIARNVSNDLYRKWRKGNTVFLENENVQTECDDIDIDDIIITEESFNILKEKIRNLESKYRDPLVLKKLDKHTISEIAYILGIPERTVKFRIHKAQQILKGELIKENEQ